MDPVDEQQQSSDGERKAEYPKRIRDLRTDPMPCASPTDWASPERALLSQYRVAETKAIEAIEWYLQQKKGKKRLSRWLRAAAIILTAAGALVPLVLLSSAEPEGAAWGYVLIAAGAACVGFDRFFGLSSAWMRYTTAVQQIQGHLELFQLDWSKECIIAASGSDARVAERISLLRRLVGDLRIIVGSETGLWEMEFRHNIASMDEQVNATLAAQRSEPRTST